MTDVTDQTQTPPSIPSDTVTFAFTVPNSVAWLASIIDAMQRLSYPGGWVQRAGGITPTDAAAEMVTIIGSNRIITGEASMAIGTIVPMLRDTLPDNYLWCDGSQHLIADWPELAAVLPAQWISIDMFTLPDMSGRIPQGKRSGEYTGQSVGSDNVYLTTAMLPDHQHSLTPRGGFTNIYLPSTDPGVTQNQGNTPGSSFGYAGPEATTGGIQPPIFARDPVPVEPMASAFRFAIVAR
jgi:microcystin-dependent protein